MEIVLRILEFLDAVSHIDALLMQLLLHKQSEELVLWVLQIMLSKSSPGRALSLWKEEKMCKDVGCYHPWSGARRKDSGSQNEKRRWRISPGFCAVFFQLLQGCAIKVLLWGACAFVFSGHLSVHDWYYCSHFMTVWHKWACFCLCLAGVPTRGLVWMAKSCQPCLLPVRGWLAFALQWLCACGASLQRCGLGQRNCCYVTRTAFG